MRKILLINIVAFIVIIGLAALLDASLELGQFHGLAFQLYLFYGCILLFIVNAIVAGVYFYNKKRK